MGPISMPLLRRSSIGVLDLTRTEISSCYTSSSVSKVAKRGSLGVKFPTAMVKHNRGRLVGHVRGTVHLRWHRFSPAEYQSV